MPDEAPPPFEIPSEEETKPQAPPLTEPPILKILPFQPSEEQKLTIKKLREALERAETGNMDWCLIIGRKHQGAAGLPEYSMAWPYDQVDNISVIGILDVAAGVFRNRVRPNQ